MVFISIYHHLPCETCGTFQELFEVDLAMLEVWQNDVKAWENGALNTENGDLVGI